MEQKIRAVLFYVCAAAFFILLPLILLYSFGYKLELSKFRFARTGLIYIKSSPEGARVFLNGRRVKGATPLSIEELMPGEYKVSLDLESYYPWQQSVEVKSGQTASLENIVLFPKKPYLSKLNILDSGNFYVFPADPAYAYCLSFDRTSIYKIKLTGKDTEAVLVSGRIDLPEGHKNLALSPDRKKLLYSYAKKVFVVYLAGDRTGYDSAVKNNFSVECEDSVLYAFWFSDSSRIVVISEKDIRIYELLSQGRNNTITVLKLRDSRPQAYFDSEEDVLYFTDKQKGADNRLYGGLYRIEMGKRSPFAFIKNLEENLR